MTQEYSMEQLLEIQKKYETHYKKQGIRMKRYFQSDKGKKALRKAQHKYYLKKKGVLAT